MKRLIGMLIAAFLVVACTLMIAPETATAGTLNEWASYFSRSNGTSATSPLNRYHFALKPVVNSRSPHVEGSTVYVYVEPYQYSYCGQDVIDKANEIWNGYAGDRGRFPAYRFRCFFVAGEFWLEC